MYSAMPNAKSSDFDKSAHDARKLTNNNAILSSNQIWFQVSTGQYICRTTGSIGGQQINHCIEDVCCHLSAYSFSYRINDHLAMDFGHYLWFITFLYVSYSNGEEKLKLLTDNNEYQMLPPRIFMPIIARNVEHSLPNWLGCLEQLDYPKDRIYLWYVNFKRDSSFRVLLCYFNYAFNL